MNPCSEKYVQRQILDYLAYEGIFHHRQNTGAMRGTYKGKGWFMRFGTPGCSDIVAVVDGRYIAIECKAKRGKQSPAQVEFQRKLEAAGGMYILARTLEDVTETLPATEPHTT